MRCAHRSTKPRDRMYLLRPALGGPVQVVATLRPGFLDNLLSNRDLADLPAHAWPLRPLRRDALATVIEARLVEKLTAEPGKQAEFAAMLNEMSPRIEVFQTISQAHGITGARVEGLMRGRVNVDQRIEHASDITGAVIERMR